MGLLTQEEYKDYCSRFEIIWKYLRKCSYKEYDVISSICKLRDYSMEGSMPDIINDIGFVYLDGDKFNKDKLKPLNKDLGLFSEEGNFLLLNRFIFPVRDMLGNIIALIGWFPDEKKYITTPSRLFSKRCMFFGMEQLKQTGIGKEYYIVEGIFDSLSIRSLGFNCVALMGISVSNYTKILYTLFKRVIAIPDNDKEGRGVVIEDKWGLPNNSSYLRLKGKFKDIDDVIKYYDMSEVLHDAWYESDRVIPLDL